MFRQKKGGRETKIKEIKIKNKRENKKIPALMWFG